MRLPHLLIACCAFVCMAAAQSQPRAATDPISGTWKGDMAPQGSSNRRPITMELKFDGASVVSGSAIGPQTFPIKAGTFDPKTGALKIEVDAKDGGRGTVFVFDGLAVQGTAIGRVTGDGQTGDFKLAKLPASAAIDAGSDLRRSFATVSVWVAKAADLAPADKYDYRPAPSVRTFGQIIAHIADSYNYYCAPGAGKIERGPTDKAALLPQLKKATDACTAAFATGQAGSLVDSLAHTNLHYGNLITYLRMLGLTPPSN